MSGSKRRLAREASKKRNTIRIQKRIDKTIPALLERFPKMPEDTAYFIARYSTEPGSGRSLRHKDRWRENIPSAVGAYIRHKMTGYDKLLNGVDPVTRNQARMIVSPEVTSIMLQWGFKE